MNPKHADAGAIREQEAPTPHEFRRTIVPSAQPVVLRRVAGDWPLVVAASKGADRCAELLTHHASDRPLEILRADPETEGRFHYAADGHSLNFVRGHASLP